MMMPKLLPRQEDAFALIKPPTLHHELNFAKHGTEFLNHCGGAIFLPPWQVESVQLQCKEAIDKIGMHAFVSIRLNDTPMVHFCAKPDVSFATLRGVFMHELGHVVEFHRRNNPYIAAYRDEEIVCDLYEWVGVNANKLALQARKIIRVQKQEILKAA